MQLSVDREVIALIRKTRSELHEIRQNYAARHSHPTPLQSVGVVTNKPLPLAFTSWPTVSED